MHAHMCSLMRREACPTLASRLSLPRLPASASAAPLPHGCMVPRESKAAALPINCDASTLSRSPFAASSYMGAMMHICATILATF